MKPIVLALLATIVISALGFTGTAYAQESGASDAAGMKLLGAGLAFGLAAAGAGIGLGQVGAAGLAVISENFVGMVESIAIYGIVMMFIILGQ
jgi:V/A-type H+-transporting ATPase subunit K